MRSIQLLERSDERGVSPVIGVILMVAITVILAAVLGSFALGLGDQIGASTPQAQIGASVSVANDEVTLEHNGGDPIRGDQTRLVVTVGPDSYEIPASTNDVLLRTGGKATIANNTTISVDWNNDDVFDASGSSAFSISEGDEVEITIVDTESERQIASITLRA